jgi:predicted ArsR family transcriptional regulator
MTPEKVETLLREVGRRMAAQWKIPPGELRVQLGAAVQVLNELGGLMERETGEETLCIRGYRCPFAAVVLEHPEVCHLAETLLTELVGMPVQEQPAAAGRLLKNQEHLGNAIVLLWASGWQWTHRSLEAAYPDCC